MLIKQISGPKPAGTAGNEYEAVYVSVYNNFAGIIPAGGSVCYDPAASVAQNLGFAVTRPATANLGLYAGAAPVAIPQAAGSDSGWGLVQCYGIMEECGQDGGTTDTASNQSLAVINGSFYPANPTAAVVGTGWVISMEAVTTATGTGRAFIRAM